MKKQGLTSKEEKKLRKRIRELKEKVTAYEYRLKMKERFQAVFGG